MPVLSLTSPENSALDLNRSRPNARLCDRRCRSGVVKLALHDPGCSRGLNPPVSSRDLAM